MEKDSVRFEPFSDHPIHVVQSIVDLDVSMGLDVGDEDVEDLVNNHREELTRLSFTSATLSRRSRFR